MLGREAFFELWSEACTNASDGEVDDDDGDDDVDTGVAARHSSHVLL